MTALSLRFTGSNAITGYGILLSEPKSGISAIILLIIAYVFDMYPEGAPLGNQFQSTQVKFR
jgi:hypothetical protein